MSEIETIGVFAVMFDWALIWVPIVLAPLLMLCGSMFAVLWMFRDRKP